VYRVGRIMTLDIATARRLAVEADVDPRSIQREYRAAHGQDRPVRGMSGTRARKALVAAGLIPTATMEGRPAS
jgi:hypothetical protein